MCNLKKLRDWEKAMIYTLLAWFLVPFLLTVPMYFTVLFYVWVTSFKYAYVIVVISTLIALYVGVRSSYII